MNDEQRDALRERNRRRAHACPRCGGTAVAELTDAAIARRDDTMPGFRYRECAACGHLWASKRPARRSTS